MLEKITMLGDFYALEMWTPPHEVLSDIEKFKDKWSKYNSFKPQIPREGLCIINEDGVNKQGPALDSLLEWNREYNTNFTELDFNVSTPVYDETILKDFLAPIRQWCYRSHFLKLPPGGYFPPHRDKSWESIRLILPLFNCNAPLTRFMLEDRTLQWELGRMYFVNTLKEHTLFNASSDQDSIWLVLNYIVNEESVMWIRKNLAIK